MRKARFVFFFLLLVLAALGVYALATGLLGPDGGRADRIVADRSDANAKTDAATSEKDQSRPTFDIVRAESDGSVIMAGQSKPGWTVSVESNGDELGRATADDNGEWIIQPKEKLSKGEHSLALSAKSPKGERTLFSKQRLALSMSDPKSGQPLVALTEEGKAARVLQMPAPREKSASGRADGAGGEFDTATVSPDSDAATKTANTIGFASVDYEESGAKSMLHMNGHAKPDTRIAIYVDNQLAGTTTADATGSWTFSGNRELGGGSHALRADLLAEEGDKVVARAEVNFERTPPVSTALLDDATKLKSYAQDDSAGPASQEAATTSPSEDQQSGKPPSVIVIKRGDTLWQIAQRHYGDGAKYTQIFQNNRAQIRDPNWIYPNQRFKLP